VENVIGFPVYDENVEHENRENFSFPASRFDAFGATDVQ
jgi:hypothetical protein